VKSLNLYGSLENVMKSVIAEWRSGLVREKYKRRAGKDRRKLLVYRCVH
jgi:hypothetical protein